MSVAADVVRGVLLFGVGVGFAALMRHLPVLVLGWWELVEPGVVSVKMSIGRLVMRIGFRFTRVGADLADVGMLVVRGHEVREVNI